MAHMEGQWNARTRVDAARLSFQIAVPNQLPPGPSMRTVRVLSIIAVVFVLAGGAAWFLWNQVSEVEMSPMGVWMLIGGVVFTLGLGIGLMALVYHSHKSGHDDRIDGG